DITEVNQSAVVNRPHQKAHTLLLSRPPRMPKIESQK
ncbi:MAG: hypothetical protein ACI9S9_005097, partial [Planctomycetota bacterium]